MREFLRVAFCDVDMRAFIGPNGFARETDARVRGFFAAMRALGEHEDKYKTKENGTV